MIYLDHAATSFPKPPSVIEAVTHCLREIGANPGRSAHRLSVAAARVVFEAREALARLLGISESRRLVFTSGATHALNLALKGLLRRGDHVVTTSLEHNSVMRPLGQLEEALGIEVTIVKSDGAGLLDPAAFARAIGPRTRLVVVNHASNVVGTLAPLRAIRQAIGEVPLLVDAAQSAGAIPLDVEGAGIDLCAFTGHKSLFGPQGTGALYVRPGLDLEPLTPGGTGSGSESEHQPEFLPDRLEGGTLNTPGIAGLGAGVRFLLEVGVEKVREHELLLFERLQAGLAAIAGVRLFGPPEGALRLPVVSLNIRHLPPSAVAHQLDRQFGVLARAGLHCAPAAHRSLGTFPGGTVRLSPGYFNTAEEIDRAVEAVAEIAHGANA